MEIILDYKTELDMFEYECDTAERLFIYSSIISAVVFLLAMIV